MPKTLLVTKRYAQADEPFKLYAEVDLGDIKAIAILKEKFAGVDSFGPGQVVEFYNLSSAEERDRQARRAFELVRDILQQLG